QPVGPGEGQVGVAPGREFESFEHLAVDVDGDGAGFGGGFEGEQSHRDMVAGLAVRLRLSARCGGRATARASPWRPAPERARRSSVRRPRCGWWRTAAA